MEVAAAEEAFVNASRYALSSDRAVPAGKALIAAGRAAFIQQAPSRVVEYTTRGLHHCPNDAQGHYQLARVFAALGDEPNAQHHLAQAFTTRPYLSIGALGEDEFIQLPHLLSAAATAARAALAAQYDELTTKYGHARQALVAGPTFGVDAGNPRATSAH